MEVKTCSITPVDIEILSAIARQTFYDTFTGTCTEEDMQSFLMAHFNKNKLLDEIKNRNNHFYFAKIKDVPAGYIQFAEDYNSFPIMKKWKALELKRLYVQEEFHGKGIAQKLMELITDYALQQKYEVIWLGVWEHNLRAKNFYKKNGFKDSGYTHNFPIGNTPQTDNWFWKFL